MIGWGEQDGIEAGRGFERAHEEHVGKEKR